MIFKAPEQEFAALNFRSYEISIMLRGLMRFRLKRMLEILDREKSDLRPDDSSLENSIYWDICNEHEHFVDLLDPFLSVTGLQHSYVLVNQDQLQKAGKSDEKTDKV
jgi:hypothetical protein